MRGSDDGMCSSDELSDDVFLTQIYDPTKSFAHNRNTSLTSPTIFFTSCDKSNDGELLSSQGLQRLTCHLLEVVNSAVVLGISFNFWLG